eukprot:jgi/Antlo1/1947/119
MHIALAACSKVLHCISANDNYIKIKALCCQDICSTSRNQ